MAIALDIAMAMDMANHFYKLDNVCTLTPVGEYRKYQYSVSGVPSGALGNSSDLMLVFSCTPLLSSRY